LNVLDLIHDSLHPFFKDEPDNKDLDKILEKLKSIEEEIKEIKRERSK
jgi:hypothetical protein